MPEPDDRFAHRAGIGAVSRNRVDLACDEALRPPVGDIVLKRIPFTAYLTYGTPG